MYVPNNGCNVYLCSLFLCSISCAFYVSIYFSQLFLSLQSFSLIGSDFKSPPEQFPSLEAKAVCIAGSVLMDEAGTSLFFSPCCNWHNCPYGCLTKSWTNFFIFKIQMEVALSWMPEWKNSQAREATMVFYIQPTMTPRCHQFAFHSREMTKILFIFHWYQLGHAAITSDNHYISVFGMLAHWIPKYCHYVIFCYLIFLTFYLWLNRGLPWMKVLPLPTL